MRRLSGYLPLAALALLTVSCESTPPTAPKANGPLAADRQNDEGEHDGGRKVTGRGKDLYPGDIGATFSISFSARGDESGPATGFVNWRFLDGTVASFGSVYCLVVRGNRAYMSYLAAGGAFDGYGTPGNSVLLGFEDNDVKEHDDGLAAPADGQTFIYFTNGVDKSCKFVQGFANFIEAGGPGGGFPVLWKGKLEIR